MCGFVVELRRPGADGGTRAFAEALDLLVHRGPDDVGEFGERADWGSIQMAHRRLSILDLSPAGRQPMQTEDGRFVVVYNGEIYNYLELKQELSLRGHRFRTRTDTEVLLAAWREWGCEALQKFVGMFAFCIYDNLQKKLLCAVDAFGIKPLYYFCSARAIVVASEPQAVCRAADILPRIEPQTAYDYLVHGMYDHDQTTFFRDVRKMLPGHVIAIDLPTFSLDVLEWHQDSLPSDANVPSFQDAVNSLRRMFLRNLDLHLRSDVAWGVALSGGLDSSAIACGVRHVRPGARIVAFHYAPSADGPSEYEHARKVAEAIGAEMHTVGLSREELPQIVDQVVARQGEPFGSLSVVAQFLVAREAHRQGIKVLLEGQGGDEILGGYDGYPAEWLRQAWLERRWSDMLVFVRQWPRGPGRGWLKLAYHLSRATLPSPLQRLVDGMAGKQWIPEWMNPGWIESEGVTARRPILRGAPFGRRAFHARLRIAQRRGLQHMLRHGDRNAMAWSVENRTPFLTLTLSEYLLSLPPSFLVSRKGVTKALLRAALSGIVPDAILQRRDKIGFRTDSDDILLSDRALRDRTFAILAGLPMFDPDGLRRAFAQTPSELTRAWSGPLAWQRWRWTNFALWAERFGVY
jgi:asparagine synthase (glutamine-hydrolysing)